MQGSLVSVAGSKWAPNASTKCLVVDSYRELVFSLVEFLRLRKLGEVANVSFYLYEVHWAGLSCPSKAPHSSKANGKHATWGPTARGSILNMSLQLFRIEWRASQGLEDVSQLPRLQNNGLLQTSLQETRKRCTILQSLRIITTESRLRLLTPIFLTDMHN